VGIRSSGEFNQADLQIGPKTSPIALSWGPVAARPDERYQPELSIG
jgi:hypothetical protein